MTNTICLHVIFKDNKDNLKRLIKSLRGIITNAVFIDDHSTAWKEGELKKYSEQHFLANSTVVFKRKLYDDEFGQLNFAAQRNFAIDNDPFNTEYICYFDSDERLSDEGIKKLLEWRSTPQRYKIFALPVRNFNTEGARTIDESKIRIWRRDLNIRWAGEVHENIDFGNNEDFDPANDAGFIDAVIEHRGYEDAATLIKKAERNYEITLKQIHNNHNINTEDINNMDAIVEATKNNDDLRYALYNAANCEVTLGMIGLAEIHYKATIETVKKECLDGNDHLAPYESLLYYNYSNLVANTIIPSLEDAAIISKYLQDLLNICIEAINLQKDSKYYKILADANYNAAYITENIFYYKQAIEYYNKVLSYKFPRDSYLYVISDYEIAPLSGIGNCHMALEEYHAAAKYFTKALEKAKEYNLPSEHIIQIAQGIMYSKYQLGNSREVIRLYRKYKAPFDLYALGECYMDAKKYDYAIKAFTAELQDIHQDADQVDNKFLLVGKIVECYDYQIEWLEKREEYGLADLKIEEKEKFEKLLNGTQTQDKSSEDIQGEPVSNSSEEKTPSQW